MSRTVVSAVTALAVVLLLGVLIVGAVEARILLPDRSGEVQQIEPIVSDPNPDSVGGTAPAVPGSPAPTQTPDQVLPAPVVPQPVAPQAPTNIDDDDTADDADDVDDADPGDADDADPGDDD